MSPDDLTMAHHLTVADLRKHFVSPESTPGRRKGDAYGFWSCGCSQHRSGSWQWCLYHEGFFDGVEAAQQ